MSFKLSHFCLLSLLLTACQTSHKKQGSPEESVLPKGAISCAKGLLPADSMRYIQGGAIAFLPTVENTKKPTAIPAGMVWIPGGTFSMGLPNPSGMTEGGSESMDDARPIHRVALKGFFMDDHEVTNREFAAFVKATGYKTIAEKPLSQQEFPDLPTELLVPGSIVFTPPSHPVALDDYTSWWQYRAGANWKQPEGPGSTIKGRDEYPVVHLAWEDAVAYAQWAGKRLPTEAEWEFAARGGKTGQLFVWGNQFRPDGKFMANTFQGQFPHANSKEDGFQGLAPVKSFSANSYGLYDMAGNVWEWCADWYHYDYYRQFEKNTAIDPQGPAESFDPLERGIAKKVQRGGSFLCTDQYCTRYMLGTRGKGDWKAGTNHVGFRCVKSFN